MQAFIDEAILRNPQNGLYVITAAVVALEDLDKARHAALSVPRGRSHRFHWRLETEKQRLRMLDVMRSAGVTMWAYHASIPGKKLERARALCIERALWDFEEKSSLVFETRQERSDAHDRRTIVHAQQAGKAAEGLSYRFEHPQDEPLLWFADAGAGAVAAALAGKSKHYLDVLGDTVVVVEVGRS